MDRPAPVHPPLRRIAVTGSLVLGLCLPAVSASAAPVRTIPVATVSAATVSAATVAAVVPAGWSADAASRRIGDTVLSVRGAGPYRIGARLTDLVARGLIDWTQPRPGHPSVVDAGATGDWAGVVLLAFRDGRLVEVGTATTPPRSPAGATVGMSFDDLEAIYGPRGGLVHNDAGERAYLVRFGTRVELFTGHPVRPGVGYFQVGPADFVEQNFLHGCAC